MKTTTVRLTLALALVVGLVAIAGCPHNGTTTRPRPVKKETLEYWMEMRDIEGYWITGAGKPNLVESCAIATRLLTAEGAPEDVAEYRAAAKLMVGNIVMSLADPRDGYIRMKKGINQGNVGHACALTFLVRAWQSDLEFTEKERALTKGAIEKAITYIEKNAFDGILPHFRNVSALPGYGGYDLAMEYVHALKAARAAGFAADGEVVEKLEDYIKRALAQYE